MRPHQVPDCKLINLALQGGGSHGAFTWGVLDRLLEEDRVAFDGISATSAGAINAVLLAWGLIVGGREGARLALAQFWRKMSGVASSNLFHPSTLDRLAGQFGLDYSPGYAFINLICQFLSPYQLNPLNLNPLKKVLEEIVDFKLIRQQKVIRLFLCATNVRTGNLKVFRSSELTPDHVVASSCMPCLMQAVAIDNEYYWDGGFVGNPALFPLIYECEAHDIVLVHLTPTERRDLPTTANAILSRMQEVSLNSSLLREMRAIAFVNRMIAQGLMTNGKQILLHIIQAEDLLGALSNTSKMNGDWELLSYLHDLGKTRANEWLASDFDSLGIQSGVNLDNLVADLPTAVSKNVTPPLSSAVSPVSPQERLVPVRQDRPATTPPPRK